MQPCELTVTAAAAVIGRRELSPVELIESVLDRAEETEGRLSAYAFVEAERARRAAARAEREIQDGGHRGPLHGIPYGLKDLIDSAGAPTSAGSRAWEGRVPVRDSETAARLRQAGAVLVGKTHTHEFAYGLLTPQTFNPWRADRTAGGSSGGSAVAVAAGSALFAIGTDTGGSIRVPAALNGVVGLKPTYGLVSCAGVAPLSWSLDTVGPLTRTAEDAALVLRALAGPGPAASGPPPEPAGRRDDLVGLRVGVPEAFFLDRVDPEVEAAVRQSVDELQELGATAVPLVAPLTEHMEATHWGLMAPEASSVHEDGLRRASHLYGPDVRLLLEAGARIRALDYLRAQRSRTLIHRAWLRLFDEVDVIAAPTVPLCAVPRGQDAVCWPDGFTESVTSAYVRLCAPGNVTGFPTLSLPVGLDTDGLPIGMQLMARPFDEATLLRTGAVFERSRRSRARSGPVLAPWQAGGTAQRPDRL
ncbi:amidase [Streptomyces sp. cmx-18-6]|uniref:amidase n=1 Tax=Streptomyces sp. cmx-18-6 TaxID=2790930 RepID=UPI00397FB30C